MTKHLKRIVEEDINTVSKELSGGSAKMESASGTAMAYNQSVGFIEGLRRLIERFEDLNDAIGDTAGAASRGQESQNRTLY